MQTKSNQIWEKGKPIEGKNPDVWRKDAAGSTIRRGSRGARGKYGWKISHKIPKSEGGDGIRNLQPLHWQTNAEEATAWRIARMMGGQYDRNKSPDIEVAGWFVVRVATPKTIAETVNALRNYTQNAYVAVTHLSAVRDAIEQTKNTDIGVMGPMGDFFKPAPRRPLAERRV